MTVPDGTPDERSQDGLPHAQGCPRGYPSRWPGKIDRCTCGAVPPPATPSGTGEVPRLAPGGTGRPGGDVPVHLLLDVWQAMGGDGEAFHAWWAADPSFPDRWSRIVAAVGGNISGLTADSNPPAGALLDLAIAHQADAALRATVAECADQLRHLADAVRSAGDVPMVRLDADGVAPEPITLADHIWLGVAPTRPRPPVRRTDVNRIKRDHKPGCRKHPEHTGPCFRCSDTPDSGSVCCVLAAGHPGGHDHGHSRWNR